MTAAIEAGAADVWETVRDFNGLPKFVSAVAESNTEGEGVGAVRTLILQDGHVAIETLEHLDDSSMTLKYSLENDPGRPFQDYAATMQVRDRGDGRCELTWSSSFNAREGISEEDAKALPSGLYAEGFQGLKRIHERT